MSYPPSSPSAPPPGINPAVLGGGDPPYPSGPGYHPPGAYPPHGGYHPPTEAYPAAGGHHQPGIPMTHQPQPGAGYPPAGAMQPETGKTLLYITLLPTMREKGDNTTQFASTGIAAILSPGRTEGSEWMLKPTGVPICPRGLEYLTMIDQLLVHQKVELLEAFLSFETKNKYTVKNSMGQKIYTAKEDTDCCTRNCCGNSRPFDIKIKDNAGMEVMHLARDLRCTACCFPCCLQRLEVFAPPGRLIGVVAQEWSICTPQFRVENERGETVLKIEGPCCTFSICGDVDFQVTSTNGVEVGKISKQWSGLLREAFTDADHFGITFPMDLDVKMKATLLGALFLIDYMFFEKEGNKESDGIGML